MLPGLWRLACRCSLRVAVGLAATSLVGAVIPPRAPTRI
jgi:hypothetical protein